MSKYGADVEMAYQNGVYDGKQELLDDIEKAMHDARRGTSVERDVFDSVLKRFRDDLRLLI